MDENNSYIYPTIAICIEDIDRLSNKAYKFTIPSINFNKKSSSEDKTEEKNQGITNIANEDNISIGKVEINNYFLINIPKEIIATTYTTVGMDGTLIGEGNNNSKLTFNGVTSNSGNINTNIRIPAHPTTEYIIRSFIMSLFRIGSGSMNGIKQSFDSYRIHAKTPGSNHDMEIMPQDRYIPKGSQWVVVFIDGDPSKPAIIARYK